VKHRARIGQVPDPFPLLSRLLGWGDIARLTLQK